MKKALYLLSFILVINACNGIDRQKVQVNALSGRIVCISKQYNEIIFALKAGKDIVAVDISSTYPPELRKLPTVGYHRALSAEAILAMKPDVVLHDNNIGPEHVVKQLQDLKINMKTFSPHSQTIEGTDSLIREMGKTFKREKEADSLCQRLDHDMETALEKSKQYKVPVRVLVIHFGQASNIYLVMTKKSTAAKMIEWAGGELAVDDDRGMKQISPEIVAASDPDVILLTDFGYDRLGGSPEKIKELPGVSATKAFRNHRIFRIEEHDLVYLGPRTGQNVMLIQNLIHQ